jgi:hypothetical protein
MFLDSDEEEFMAEDGLFISTLCAAGDVDAFIVSRVWSCFYS